MACERLSEIGNNTGNSTMVVSTPPRPEARRRLSTDAYLLESVKTFDQRVLVCPGRHFFSGLRGGISGLETVFFGCFPGEKMRLGGGISDFFGISHRFRPGGTLPIYATAIDRD